MIRLGGMEQWKAGITKKKRDRNNEKSKDGKMGFHLYPIVHYSSIPVIYHYSIVPLFQYSYYSFYFPVLVPNKNRANREILSQVIMTKEANMT